MAGIFGANPAVLRSEGLKIVGHSETFDRNIKTIYSTTHEMVNSDFLSPDAKAIANDIESYKSDFETMSKLIAAYGSYCMNASTKIINNQQQNIDNIH